MTKRSQSASRHKSAWRIRKAVLATALASSFGVAGAATYDVHWTGTQGNWQDSASWATGTVPGFWARVFIDSALTHPLQPAQVTLSTSMFAQELFVGASDRLRISAGGDLALFNGVIVNKGLLELVGDDVGRTRIRLDGPTTLSGSGTTLFTTGTNGWSRASIEGYGPLTIAAGHTVRGSGSLGGVTGLQITNRGTVIAESGGMDLSGGVYGTSLTFDNTAGLIQVTSDGYLWASSTLLGGTVQGLGAGSTVWGAMLDRVTLTGNLKVSSATFKDVSIGGNLTLAGGQPLFASGTLTNNGTLTVADSQAGRARLIANGNLTLAGTGTTTIRGDAWLGNDSIYASNSTITIASDHILRGSGQISASSRGAALVNRGTIIAEGGTLKFALQDYNAQGYTGLLDNSAGVIHVAADAKLTTSNTIISGGTVHSLGHGARLSNASFTDITLAGTFTVTGDDSIALRNATISDRLDIDTSPGRTLVTAVGTLTVNGQLVIAGNSSGRYGGLGIAGPTTLAGTGTTFLGSPAGTWGGMIMGGKDTSSLVIAREHTLRGAGSVGPDLYGAKNLPVVNHGTVIAENGDLSFQGSFDATDGILIAEANSVLTLWGPISLSDTSRLRVGVSGAGGSLTAGLFRMGPTVNFDGQVLLDLSGANAKVGDSFSFASYLGSYTGQFDAVLAPGFNVSVTYANHLVTATLVSVNAVPEPSSWAMTLVGGLGLLWAVRRRRAVTSPTA